MGLLSSIGSVFKAVPIVGDLITGGASYSSAQQQMKFQEEMSGTAHQREIKDLKAAGLNPILSAKYGGASTPMGAGFQMPVVGSSAQSMAGASKTRTEEKSVIPATVKSLEAQAGLATSNSAKASAEYNKILEETKNVQKQNKIMDQAVEAARIESEIDRTKYGKFLRYLNRLNPFGSSARSLMPPSMSR